MEDQSKRDDFLADMRKDAKNRMDSVYYWEHNWDVEDLELDPKVPVGG